MEHGFYDDIDMTIHHFQLLCRVVTGIERDKTEELSECFDETTNKKIEDMRGIQRPDAKNVYLTEKAITESVQDKDLIVNWYDWNMYSWNEVISNVYIIPLMLIVQNDVYFVSLNYFYKPI